GIAVDPAEPVHFRLHLRIPTWAGERFVPGDLYRYADDRAEPVTLSVNGRPIEAPVERGFAFIDRTWRRGDRVVLHLPMPVRINECHPAVAANRKRIAFTRGPLVLCAEGVDNGGATQRFFFEKRPDTSRARLKTTRIPGGSFIQVELTAQALTKDGGIETRPLVLTPYYAWNNRGISSMTVWFPTDRSLAVFDPHALPRESVFAEITASHTAAEDTVNAIGDGKVDRWSSGNRVPRWTSRGQPGKKQWIVGRFREPRRIRSVGVFWMDRWQGDVRLPKEWSLEVRQDGRWKPFPLYTTDRYDTRANQFNVVHPAAPLVCDAIRINITPRENTAVGIIEVQVTFEDR
ncbi:MAG: hypothetical protein D6725_13045, partial [Planctomycetota bacterium]